MHTVSCGGGDRPGNEATFGHEGKGIITRSIPPIQKQLRETDLPEELLWDSSQYIVGMVFEVLREMFSNAKVIQVIVVLCVGPS